MKIQNKMAPPYHGPYKVSGTTENDNYILKTSTGNILTKTYPLSQLKIVSDDKDDVVIFEEILEHRVKRGGRMEYLVKYVNKSVAEATWVKEAHFTATDLIESYWEKTGAPAEIDTVNLHLTSARPGKQTSWLKIMLTTLAVWCCLPSCKGQSLQAPFKLCDTTNKVLLNTQLTCNNRQFVNRTQLPALWHIFEKRTNKDHDIAHVCKKYLITAVAEMGIFGHESLAIQSKVIHLTASECRSMVTSKMCGTNKMFCSEDTCAYRRDPEVKYRWLRTISTDIENCFIGTTRIQAIDETVTLFEGVYGKCKPIDLFCPTPDSVIVWMPQVIHKCVLEYVESGSFLRKNTLVYTKSKVESRFAKEAIM